MRTLRLAAALAVGGWIGWRVARSGWADRVAGRGATPGSLAERLEKLVALVELGGERGLELVQGVVGRRTGRAT